MKTVLFLILFSLHSTGTAIAAPIDLIFPQGNLLMLAPPVVNKDYFQLEFGFVTAKKVKDSVFNAYVTAALFQDSLNQSGKLKAGGLGFKGGVMIPTQPWIPLLFTMTGGFAKTALHKNPFLGKDDSAVADKDMFLLEPGLLYRHNKNFIRTIYQVSNVKYFKRNFIINFGVVY